jgi:hypothetical protein
MVLGGVVSFQEVVNMGTKIPRSIQVTKIP